MKQAYKDVLKGAYDSLCSGRNMFVCPALVDGLWHGGSLAVEEKQLAYEDVKTRIDEAINHYGSVTRWLWDQGISAFDTTPEAMLEYRKAWVRELYFEYVGEELV